MLSYSVVNALNTVGVLCRAPDRWLLQFSKNVYLFFMTQIRVDTAEPVTDILGRSRVLTNKGIDIINFGRTNSYVFYLNTQNDILVIISTNSSEQTWRFRYVFRKLLSLHSATLWTKQSRSLQGTVNYNVKGFWQPVKTCFKQKISFNPVALAYQ